MLRIAVVADYQPTRPSHVATDAALGHAGRGLGIDYSREWLPTERVATDSPHLLEPFDGFFIGPEVLTRAFKARLTPFDLPASPADR